MRYIRRVFHWRVLDAVFSALRLWHVHAALAGFARLGWIPGILSLGLVALIQRGGEVALDWVAFTVSDGDFFAFLAVALGLALLPVNLILFLWALDLVWLSLTVPKQFLLGDLFSNENIEKRNLRHIGYIEQRARA